MQSAVLLQLVAPGEAFAADRAAERFGVAVSAPVRDQSLVYDEGASTDLAHERPV